MKHDNKLRIISMTGMLIALTAAATLLIRIPTPTKGYINVGDAVVIISGWLLGPLYGAAVGGIGSALADLISGYTVYIPATLVIKGIMSAAASWIYEYYYKKIPCFAARTAAAAAAECIMMAGYALFAAILHGNAAAAVLSLPGNIIQAGFGAVVSVILYESLVKRIKIK